MKFQASAQGIDELKKTLEKLPSQALQDTVLDQSSLAGAKKIVHAQKARAPRGRGHKRYGHLKENIRVNKAPKHLRREDLKGHMVIHNEDAFWGLFLEFGTVHASPHPWARPGLNASWEDAVNETGRRMFKILQREADKLSGTFGGLGKARKRRLGKR